MVDIDNPRRWYEKARGRIPRAADDGKLSKIDVRSICELLDSLDPNVENVEFRESDGYTKTLASKTLANYSTRLRLAATELESDLLDQDTGGIDRLTESLVRGTSDVGPDDGYARGTIGQYQSALKAFYRFHEGHEVKPEKIRIAAPSETSIDADDMFTIKEVRAMRQAINTPRERCLFELLAHTGQRIRAIQTLRIRDIDLENGEMSLNESKEGLKGASGVRPLLGAKPYVEDWLDIHPTYFDPDAFLITPLPEHGGGGTPGAMLCQESMRYHLRKIARKAGVDKNVHPHIFRHYFTTIAKSKYGLDDAFIKHLRGDSPGSRVMETTYRHLTDSEAIEYAKTSREGEIPDVESPLSPVDECPNCETNLPVDSKACFSCGTVFTPDAVEIQERLSERLDS